MTEYKPLQQKAYEYLRQKILLGQLTPGTIYSETRLSAELGISRTPMKDALVRLSQDKYIDIIPSKGFRLHVMSEQDIWATYQARTAIEGFCALNLTSMRDTPVGQETLHQLESSLTAMQQAIERGESNEAVLAYDLHFHQALVRSAQNPEMTSLFESYNHRLYIIAMESFERPGRPAVALTEHQAIYRAILSDGADADMTAYRAVMHHMEASRDIALQH